MKTPARCSSFVAACILFGLFVVSCAQKEADQSGLPCQPGVSEPCYTGLAGTAGVGVCRTGQSFCWEEGGVVYGPVCRNQVTPVRETCNGLDDDCDGEADNNGACAEEAIQQIKDEIGDVAVVIRPELSGTYLAVNSHWASLYYCPADRSDERCVYYFLNRFAESLFGLKRLNEQLVETKRSRLPGGGVVVAFRQYHRGIPVEGGGLSVSANESRIAHVFSTVLPVREDTPTEPMLPEEELPSIIDGYNGDGIVSLTIYTKRDAGGYLPETDFQEQVLAYKVQDGGRVYFVQAASDRPAVLGDGDEDVESEMDGVAYPFARVLYAYNLGQGNLKHEIRGMAAGAELLGTDQIDELLDSFCKYTSEDILPCGQSGHFEVCLPDGTQAECGAPENYCSQLSSGLTCEPDDEGAEVASCSTSDRIYICPGEPADPENILHEASHHLFSPYFEPATVADYSISEALAIFHSELFQCYEKYLRHVSPAGGEYACDWDTPHGDLSVAPLSIATSEDLSGIYDNALILGHALYLIWKHFSDGFLYDFYMHGGQPPLSEGDLLANRKMRRLIYAAVRHYLSAFEGAQRSVRLETLNEILFSACVDLKSMQRDEESMIFTNADCTAVRSAFKSVGLEYRGLNTTLQSFVELCNGIDDNDDGLVDNCIDFASGMCERNNTLARSYYTGDPRKLGVGECGAGFQKCVDGEWQWLLPQYSGQEETCNYKDDDCDGLTDEEGGIPYGLQVVYMLDRDKDCYGGLGEKIYLCTEMPERKLPPDSAIGKAVANGECGVPSDAGIAFYVPYVNGNDCNDDRSDIHPNAEERCNSVDDNCVSGVDEKWPSLGQQCSDGEGECKVFGAMVCKPDQSGIECNAEELPPKRYYYDRDKDGYTTGDFIETCSPDLGLMILEDERVGGGDCADFDRDRHPGAEEVCNGVDDDCDDKKDESANGVENSICPKFVDGGEYTVSLDWKGGGDCDFAGGGVNVDVKVYLSEKGTKLHIQICVEMTELESDWTYGKTCVEKDIEIGYRFSVESADAQHSYQSTSHNEIDVVQLDNAIYHGVSNDLDNIIRSIKCKTDQDDDDMAPQCSAGYSDCSGCWIKLNNIHAQGY
ncbi:MAG: hypothetical protein C4523_06505 [Myxococcales bacterium]|nr:MAG: hypothetical protein C4523_06505 [Myxococcales bacterium]